LIEVERPHEVELVSRTTFDAAALRPKDERFTGAEPVCGKPSERVGEIHVCRIDRTCTLNVKLAKGIVAREDPELVFREGRRGHGALELRHIPFESRVNLDRIPPRAELKAESAIRLEPNGKARLNRVGRRALEEERGKLDPPRAPAHVEEEDRVIAELVPVFDLSENLDAKPLLFLALARFSLEPEGAIFRAAGRWDLGAIAAESHKAKDPGNAERFGELAVDEASLDPMLARRKVGMWHAAAFKDGGRSAAYKERFRIKA